MAFKELWTIIVDWTSAPNVGVNYIYGSLPQSKNASDNAIEVVVKFEEILPDPYAGNPSRASVVVLLEEELSPGVWRPFQSQVQPIVSTEQGASQIFTYWPNIFNFDESVPFDMYDGEKTIARQYKSQGYLADTFRVCVVAINGVDPSDPNEGPKAFQWATFSISYKTYNV